MLLLATSLIFTLILIASYSVSGLEIKPGYLQHPLWFGLSTQTVRILSILQVLGVLGYFTWTFRADDTVPNLLLNTVFFACQLTWPHFAAEYQRRRPGAPLWLTLAMCTPLWIATVCLVTLLIVQHDDFVSATSLGMALLLFGLLDGIVWSMLAFKHR